MKIASIILPGEVNSIYRSLIPMEALAGRGHRVHVEERAELVQPERFREFDVVHFWRLYRDEMQRFAKALRRTGVSIVWDNDDDLSSIPRGNVGYARAGGMRGRSAMVAMARMMRIADVVTVPSETLATRFREASGADVRVLENYLPDKFVRPPTRPGVGFTIGWMAGHEHRTDFELLRLQDVFVRVLERNPHAELMTIGLKLPIDHPRYRPVPPTAYGELPNLLAQFNVGIAPLANIPFNQARSNIKLKEYGAIGVPWLASPVGPYVGMGESQGGQLIADDRWGEALDAVIADAGRRRQLAQQAKAWAQTQTISQHVDRWEQVLNDAIAHTRVASG